MRKHKEMKKRIFASFLLVALFVTGCGAEKAEVPKLLDPVCGQPQYAAVRRGDLSDKKFYDGYVTPDYVYVRIEGDRQIGEVYKWIGDTVKAGDKLAEYDLTNARQTVERLEREIAAREAENARAKAVGEAQLLLSEARRRAAEENAETLHRQMETSRDQILSKKEELKAKAEETGKSKKEIRKEIKDEQAVLEGYKTQRAQEIETAQGYAGEEKREKINQQMNGELEALDLSKMKEELARAKEEIAQNTLIAPCDGRVVGNTVNQTNEIITPDQNLDLQGSVYIIAKENRKYVTVYGLTEGLVPRDARVSAVVDGKRYELTPAAYDADFILSVKEHSQKEAVFDARFTCDDPAFFEKLAMADFVNVCVEKNRRENVLIAPRDAVYGSGAETYVLRMRGDQQEKVMVETGASNAVETEIVSGVSEGDTLLLGSIYFQTEEYDTAELKKGASEWTRDIGNVAVFPRYYYPARPKVESSKVDEVRVAEGDQVKKGDVLFKLKIPSVQSEIDRMEYRLSCHDQDAAKELAQLEKEIGETEAARDALLAENPQDSGLLVFDRQIDYQKALLERRRAQLDAQRISLQNTLEDYRAKEGDVYVRAGCDGEVGYISQNILDRTIKRSWGEELGRVIPEGSDTFAIFEKADLNYGQKVTVTKGTGADAERWECEAILTTRNQPAWYSDHFSSQFQTVLYQADDQLDPFLTKVKAHYVIKRYESCYQVTRKMVFEDGYGPYVYLVTDGRLEKRYVMLTEFRDGTAVVLDGIDEDCTVIERRRE